MTKNVRYTGVCLPKQQRALFIQKMEAWMASNLPNLLVEIKYWRKFADHSTICMGELPTELSNMIGAEIILVPTHIGFDRNVVALKVSGNYLSKNDIPHITYAVNLDQGAKPEDSKKLTNWKPLDFEMKLTGIVREIR